MLKLHLFRSGMSRLYLLLILAGFSSIQPVLGRRRYVPDDYYGSPQPVPSKLPPQSVYNTFDGNSYQEGYQQSRSCHKKVEKKMKPSISCILFELEGCQASCGMVSRIHGSTNQPQCIRGIYCDCNETYNFMGQKITIDQFQDLSFDQLWKYKFVESSTTNNLRRYIQSDEEMYDFVLSLLRDAHTTGDDIIRELVIRYPNRQNLQQLQARKTCKKQELIGDRLKYDHQGDKYRRTLHKVSESCGRKAEKMKYRRKLIELLKSITDEYDDMDAQDLEYILQQIHLSGDQWLYKYALKYLRRKGYVFEIEGKSSKRNKRRKNSKKRRKSNSSSSSSSSSSSEEDDKYTKTKIIIIHKDEDTEALDEYDIIELTVVNDIIQSCSTTQPEETPIIDEANKKLQQDVSAATLPLSNTNEDTNVDLNNQSEIVEILPLPLNQDTTVQGSSVVDNLQETEYSAPQVQDIIENSKIIPSPESIIETNINNQETIQETVINESNLPDTNIFETPYPDVSDSIINQQTITDVPNMNTVFDNTYPSTSIINQQTTTNVPDTILETSYPGISNVALVPDTSPTLYSSLSESIIDQQYANDKTVPYMIDQQSQYPGDNVVDHMSSGQVIYDTDSKPMTSEIDDIAPYTKQTSENEYLQSYDLSFDTEGLFDEELTEDDIDAIEINYQTIYDATQQQINKNDDQNVDNLLYQVQEQQFPPDHSTTQTTQEVISNDFKKQIDLGDYSLDQTEFQNVDQNQEQIQITGNSHVTQGLPTHHQTIHHVQSLPDAAYQNKFSDMQMNMGQPQSFGMKQTMEQFESRKKSKLHYYVIDDDGNIVDTLSAGNIDDLDTFKNILHKRFENELSQEVLPGSQPDLSKVKLPNGKSLANKTANSFVTNQSVHSVSNPSGTQTEVHGNEVDYHSINDVPEVHAVNYDCDIHQDGPFMNF